MRVKKTTYALCAILVGGIGIHKFVCGKPLIGVLYIALCWTYVPAIVGLIEGIIMCTKDADGYGEVAISDGFFEFGEVPYSNIDHSYDRDGYVNGYKAVDRNVRYDRHNEPVDLSNNIIREKSVINKADEILKLKELLDCGALTQEEFEAEKKKILNSNNEIHLI